MLTQHKPNRFWVWALVVILIGLAIGLSAGATASGAGEDARDANAAAIQLSGQVFVGLEGDETQPLFGATVRLYGSKSATYPSPGDQLDIATTNSAGYYALDVPAGVAFRYYHIIETNPTGYVSTGSSSVGGVTMTDDWIQYMSSLDGKILTRNKFWDQRRATPTPTATRTATRTPTPTATPPCVTNANVRKTLLGHPSLEAVVGEELTYVITVTNTGQVPITYRLVDTTQFDYLEFVSSTPAPDLTDLWLASGEVFQSVAWHIGLSLSAGESRLFTLTLRAKAPHPSMVNKADLTYFSSCVIGLDFSYAQVRILPRPGPFRVVKRLLDPSSGVADVGDTARFEIRVQNLGATTVTNARLVDWFLESQFDFLAALPPPTFTASASNWHFLAWENLTLAPHEVLTFTLDLRVKEPASDSENCALAQVLGAPGQLLLSTDKSCAVVHVNPLPGKHLRVDKELTFPPSHVATVGQMTSWDTAVKSVGTMTFTKATLDDWFTSGCGAPETQHFGWFDMSGQGYTQIGIGLMIEATSACHPAINSAMWTVTWADKSIESATATDYVDIVQHLPGPGLFLTKTLLTSPTAAVSDTVRFQIIVTNATAVSMPIVRLTDTFPASCLRFLAASLPPDSVVPGTVTWNNIGPLLPGTSRKIIVAFHAEAACQDVFNCARAELPPTMAAPVTVIGCARVEIEGGGQPRLTIRKQRQGPSPVFVGDVVGWWIDVTNAGTVPIAVVPLRDGYNPALFEFVSAVPLATVVDTASGELTWANIGPLAPGETASVAVRLRAKVTGIGLPNCAETWYPLGGVVLHVKDCDTVDVVKRGAAIQVEKVVASPGPPSPIAVGETVAFTVTVRNSGTITLTNVVVRDEYDPACLTFLLAQGAPTTLLVEGVLETNVGQLGIGESRSWIVVFRAAGPCDPARNCVIAHGVGIDGAKVSDEACRAIRIVPRDPGLDVTKRQIWPEGFPPLNGIVRYDIVVRNTGNVLLNPVPVVDQYDPQCMEYVSANPAPDAVNTATGQIAWGNIGPLPPGAAKVLTVWLRLNQPCTEIENCATAQWVDHTVVLLEDEDCVQTVTGVPIYRVYCPIVMVD